VFVSSLQVEDFEKWAAALRNFTRKSTDGPGTPLAGAGGTPLPPVSEDGASGELQDAIEKAESMNQVRLSSSRCQLFAARY